MMKTKENIYDPLFRILVGCGVFVGLWWLTIELGLAICDGLSGLAGLLP